MFPLLALSAQSASSQQRDTFIAAEKALKNSQLSTFETLKTQLHDDGYVLASYLDYAALQRLFAQNKMPVTEVHAFLQSEAGNALGDRLRSSWLYYLAKNNQWSQFLADYVPNNDNGLRCYAIYAQYKTSGDPSMLNEAKSLWLSGKSQPPACSNTFDAWRKTGGLTEQLIWDRIYLAMEANQYPVVNFLIRYLPAAKQTLAQTWLNTYRDPKIITSDKLFRGSDPFLRDTQLYGLQRIARKDPQQAAKIWDKLDKKYTFTDAQRYRAYRIIAVSKAMDHENDALDWFNKLPLEAHDDTAYQWHARALLRADEWEGLLTLIPAFPEHIRRENIWNYWLARAYENTGKNSEARSIYRELSKERSYAGFLASDRLNAPYPFNLPQPKITDKDLKRTRDHIGIARAIELHDMGRISAARREWIETVALLDEKQLQAAAQIAYQNGWQERALLTLARAENQNNLNIRFPVLYRESIDREAKKNNLNPAWVFAIARRESAFIPDARSPVGATGLMQLMPYTAKQIAKQIKETYSSPQQLTNTTYNIRLGSAYLSKIYKDLDSNMVLATAAYNAGPSRVKQWLPNSGSLETDIWVETIPFYETREYVKAVMVYRMIYQHHLNIEGRLDEVMTKISA